MKIDSIYIAGCAKDYRYTRCCVSSIRQWYEDIPMFLLKDQSAGYYDTTELEKYWNVKVFPSARKLLGYGFGKWEPLFLPKGERCLILDSDTIFVGRVLDAIEQFDEDFIVAGRAEAQDLIQRDFFNLEKLQEFDRSFIFPGYVFNGGQFVATSGIFSRQEFEELLAEVDPPKVKRQDIFPCGEQGITNYMLMKKHHDGRISMKNVDFWKWPPHVQQDEISIDDLSDGTKHQFILHWAGTKAKILKLNPHGELLQHFEDLYFTRVPGGRPGGPTPVEDLLQAMAKSRGKEERQ
jgi:hypothetical protein